MNDELKVASTASEDKTGSDKETILSMLHKAGEFQAAGKILEAESAYEEILKIDQNNKFANQLLGGLALKKGDFIRAQDFIKKALIVDPDNPELNSNLGNALLKLHRLDEAKKHYNKALETEPDYAPAHNGLGATLREEGNCEEAEKYHVNALEYQPKNPRLRNNYANTLREMGRTDEAIKQYLLAVECDPHNADTFYNLGVLHENLANDERAYENYMQALDLCPDHPEANFNLGNVLRRMGKFETAIEKFQAAIKARPDYAEAHNNLGHSLRVLGDKKTAEKHWKQAVDMDIQLADAQVNLGLVDFEQGDLESGWKRYEWRDKAYSYESPQRSFPQPKWDGTSLENKEIILWGEQGLADEILYASMIPDILKKGGKVTIECTARLVELFTRSFEGAEIYGYPYKQGEDGQRFYDFQSSFPSLGQHLRKKIDDFPTLSDNYAYLKVDIEKKLYWQKKLSTLSNNPKIGLSWTSKYVKEEFRHFYASISDMEPLLSLKNIDFICLVPADVDLDIQEASEEFDINIHKMPGLDLKNDIDGVAALMSNLDVIVSCLSATSELAGALGVRTLGFIGEKSHSIMLGTQDNVWFPNTHYFAKDPDDPWRNVFQGIKNEVKSTFGR